MADARKRATKKHSGQFKKGVPRPKGSGRTSGTKNKRTVEVADALQAAFDGVGGVDALVSYAKSDTAGFYKLWVKMLPQKIKADITLNTPLIELIQEGRRRVANGE